MGYHTRKADLLQFIYERLVYFYKEDEQIDYMVRLNEIVLEERREAIMDGLARANAIWKALDD